MSLFLIPEWGPPEYIVSVQHTLNRIWHVLMLWSMHSFRSHNPTQFLEVSRIKDTVTLFNILFGFQSLYLYVVLLFSFWGVGWCV